MSAEFWNKLKHLHLRCEALEQANTKLTERVAALEGQPPEPAPQEQPVKRGPGRPRKVKSE